MADNPLNYSDLLVPDSSIEDAIKQLKELNKEYKGLMDSVKKNASSLSKGLQGATGATEEQQETIRKTATEVDKLARAQKQLSDAMSENAKKIAELNLQKKEQQNINKLQAKANAAEEGSYDRLSAQYSLNKIRLNKLSEEYRTHTAEGRKLVAETEQIYQKMIRLQESTGKYTLSVGNYGKAFQGLNMSIAQLSRELPALAIGPSTFFLAISNNLPILFDSISQVKKENAAAAAEGQKTVPVWKQITKAFLSWNTVLSVGVALLTLYGGELVDWIGSLFKAEKQIDYLKDAMQGVADAEMEGAKNAKESTVRLKLLYEASQDAARSTDERKRAIKELKEQYPDYFANMEDEEILAGKAAGAYEKLSASIIATAMARAAEAKIEENSKKILELEDKKAEAILKQEEAKRKLIKAEKEATYVVTGGEAGAEAQRQALVRAKELKDEVEDYGKKAAEAGREIEALNIANEKLASKIDIRDLTGSEKTTTKLKEAKKEELKLEEVNMGELMKIWADMREKREKEAQQRIEDEERLARELAEAQLKQFDDEQALAKSEFDLLQTTEEEKTRFRINQEIDRWNKIIEIGRLNGEKLTETEIATFENYIKALQQQLNDLGKENETRDIYDLLGIKLDDQQKQVIASSVGYVISQLQSILAANVQIKEQILQNAKEETQAAEERYQNEIEARNAGYANDVATAKKELDLARQKEEEALEEKKKAQKQQLALETVLQTQSLITASANFWRAFSPLGLIGKVLAVATIATMFSSFLAAKVKAAQVVKEQYGEGGLEILQGGSHASGNDIPIGTTKDGKSRRAEGGEALAIINRRNTMKYRHLLPSIIQSLNNGTFEKTYSGAFKAEVMDLGKIENEVSEIRRNQGNSIVVCPDGTRIEIKGNVRRVIR